MTFSVHKLKVLQSTGTLEMVIRNMQLQLYECILGRMESFSNLDARVQDSLFLQASIVNFW